MRRKKLFFLSWVTVFPISVRAVTPKDERFLSEFYRAIKAQEPFKALCDRIDKTLVENVQDYTGATSLIIAVLGGNARIVEYLLKKGSKAYMTDGEQKSPLMYAAGSKQVPDSSEAVEIINLLLSHNANDNTTQALTLAARAGYVKKVEALLKGVASYAQDALEDLSVRIVDSGETYKKIQQLLEKNVKRMKKKRLYRSVPTADVKIVQRQDFISADYAVESLGAIYQDAIISKIFIAGTRQRLTALQSINVQNYWGLSSFMIAAKAKNGDMFRYILSMGAEWRLADLFGNTVLVYAATNNMYQGLTLSMVMPPLTSREARSQNVLGLTAAEIMRQRESVALIKMLFGSTLVPRNENADPYAQALREAARAGFFDVVSVLIEYGHYTTEQLTALAREISDLLNSYKEIDSLLSRKIVRRRNDLFTKPFVRTSE